MMRRGGVIPNVEFVSKAGNSPVEIPEKCPTCASDTRWEKDFLLCTSRTCKSVMIGMLSHYASAVDMLGFGDNVLEQAYDKGYLRNPADFYTLTVDKLTKLERSGEKLAKKLVAEVDKKRALDLATFLRALGIAELGKNVSKILAERYKTLDGVLAVTEEELGQVHGIGSVIAHTAVQGLKDNAALIANLRTHITINTATAATATASGPKGTAFEGMSFVFTGKMGSLERKPAEDLVATLGGTSLDAVNKTLTYLVVGDLKKPGDKSTKEKTADKLVAAGAPIKIISETDFIAMVEQAKKSSPAPTATPQVTAAPPAPVVVAPVPVVVAPVSAPVVVTPTPKAAPRKLEGKRFSLTGTFATMSPADATRRIESHGATVVDLVDKTTTHLVVGDKGRAGEKLTLARKLVQEGIKIEILDEKSFGALVGAGQMSLF
jgi:NAD-dependent DNA ligase